MDIPNSAGEYVLSLVIPCYNEEKRVHMLTGAIKEFEGQAPFTYEVIVVDDGSRDRTIALLENDEYLKGLAATGKFRLIISEANGGKGAALRKGILAARGQYVLTLDADMSTHPSQLLEWMQKNGNSLPGNQIWIGSRAHAKSELIENPSRKFVGIVFNTFVRTFTSLRVMDSQCGFKLYPAATGKLLFGDMQVYGWAHDVEVLYKAVLLDIPVVEMPITWTVRDDSKVSVIRDSIKMFFQILNISIYVKNKWKKDAAKAQLAAAGK